MLYVNMMENINKKKSRASVADHSKILEFNTGCDFAHGPQ
jgi:hypothetical protein